jgi:NADPH:quinone reductase-like Zn-dependent oxidoreductase
MTTASTMRALRFEQFGPPQVLRLEEVPRPVPGEGEALIEIHAAAVNPSDVKNVQGLMSHTMLPRTPGRDFAGVVVAGPDDLRGQEVWGTGGDLGFTRDGSHAEYLLLPREALLPRPRALSMEQAAGIGVSFLAAWLGLMEIARLTPGETVLIIGGAGAVGTAVTQIARWQGARTVMATVRGDGEGDPEWRRHVDVVVNLQRQDLAQAVKEATDGRGADIVYNAVGGPTFEPGVHALAARGRLVCISVIGDRNVRFDLLDFYRRELRFFGLNTLLYDAIAGARALRPLLTGFEGGQLSVRTGTTFPLDEAISAYELVGQGASGKVALVMQ